MTQMMLFPGIVGVLFLLAYFALRPIPDGDLWAFCVFGIPYMVMSIMWACFIRWYMYFALARNVRRFFAEGSTDRCSVGGRWNLSMIGL